MAADTMAKNLLGLAETADTDSVRLAATNSALDRSGLAAKSTVDLEISAKGFERVFDRIVSGPREAHPALEGGILEEGSDNPSSESEDEVVVGEFDDDVIEDDLLGVQPQRDSVGVIDVEIDMGYTDQSMTDDGSAPITPGDDDSSASEPHSPDIGPLGANGPTGSGLMSIIDATAAVAEMRARHAARMREMRRR